MRADPKRAEREIMLTTTEISGSARVKAARRTLMRLTQVTLLCEHQSANLKSLETPGARALGHARFYTFAIRSNFSFSLILFEEYNRCPL